MADSKQLEVCGDPACAQKLASYQKVVGENEIKIVELDEKLDTACQKRSESQIALIEARNEILSWQTRISSSMQNAMRPTEEEVALREQLHGMQAENASLRREVADMKAKVFDSSKELEDTTALTNGLLKHTKNYHSSISGYVKSLLGQQEKACNDYLKQTQTTHTSMSAYVKGQLGQHQNTCNNLLKETGFTFDGGSIRRAPILGKRRLEENEEQQSKQSSAEDKKPRLDLHAFREPAASRGSIHPQRRGLVDPAAQGSTPSRGEPPTRYQLTQDPRLQPRIPFEYQIRSGSSFDHFE